VTAVVLLGDIVERPTQRYLVTEVLNMWEVSMGGSHNSNTRTLTISTPSAEAHGWHHDIGKNWHIRAPASGEYTITLEDGRVRPKHVDE
jgi:hypothetical protein